PFFYAWRRDGDVYLFRQRNWFIEKRHNVPERDIRRWLGHLKADGRITVEDLTELARLSDRQLDNVSRRDIPTSSARRHREVLKLYAALNWVRRGNLEITGLRVRELNPTQTELLSKWKPAATAGADDRLRLRREQDRVIFSFESGTSGLQEERIPLT